MGIATMTSIRTIVVLASIVGALAAGILGASLGDSRLLLVLVVGVMAILWGLLHLVEQSIGHDIWHFEALYPYRPIPNQAEQIHLRARQLGDGKESGASFQDALETPAAA
jgi:hypothetical protein